MMVYPRRRGALLMVHAAVLLFGLAGVLGKLTDLPATSIVLGRVLVGGLALAVLLNLRHIPLRPRRGGDLSALALSGLVLAFHWTAFFQAILVSNVAVALLSFSTFPLFTTILEPLLLRERPRRIDALAALLILPGIYLIVPSLRLSDHVTLGVAWGLLAGLTFALLSIWNRRLRRTFSSPVISLYQDGAAAVALLPTLIWIRPVHGLSAQDVIVLLILGIACTALSHTLFIEGMRTVTAQTASVIAALEPVWGILFALAVLREVPGARTLAGGALVVGATMLPALRRPRAPLDPSSEVAPLGSEVAP